VCVYVCMYVCICVCACARLRLRACLHVDTSEIMWDIINVWNFTFDPVLGWFTWWLLLGLGGGVAQGIVPTASCM
jgi:hypothetical protein